MKDKTTSEEKHYQKLNKRLQQDLNKAEERGDRLYKTNYNMAKEMTDLESRIAILEKENEILKEKLNLTDDEVKKLLKASSGIEMLAGMSKMFRQGW